jgi:hypothetical protein
LLQAGEIKQVPRTPDYRSLHFDEPNIIAHMRVDDRFDASGNKVLFVEELQSDWGQQGKKRGFQTSEKADLPEGTKVYDPGMLPPGSEPMFTVQLPESVYGRNLFYGRTREEAIESAQNFIAQRSANPLPSAPFVQNTEDWLNLSLKRLITDAVNNDYKKVAFINGQQSADRYDLSKQVDDLRYGDDILVALRDGQIVVTKEAKPEELSNVVGKEIADRLLKAPEMEGNGYRRLTGLDLKVGGEGMKKFYDQIIPNTVNKLLKKLGGGKMETVKLEDGLEQIGFTITPEMRELVKGGLPLFAKGGRVLSSIVEAGKKAKEAQAAGKPQAPEIKKTGKIARLEQKLKETGGEEQSRRLQRAADEIEGLERMFHSRALEEAFRGRAGYPFQGVMTMKPEDFKNWASPLEITFPDGTTGLGTQSKQNIAELQELLRRGRPFRDVPYLSIGRKGGLPIITGHEGRHRTRAMEAEGYPSTLVTLFPDREMEFRDVRGKTPEQWRQLVMESMGPERLMLPEEGMKENPKFTRAKAKRTQAQIERDFERDLGIGREIDRYYSEGLTHLPDLEMQMQFPEIYAKGGAVLMKKGGSPLDAMIQAGKKAKAASDAKRREERVQQNLEKYMGTKDKPKTLYHATQATDDFSVFDLERRPHPAAAKAVFVTPSPQWASDWIDADMKMLEKTGVPKPRVMPVITRAKNPFDYENPTHVNDVLNRISMPGAFSKEHVAEQIGEGNWNFIEDRKVQQAIKDLGFDSFYVQERGMKNLGVFDPTDVKSLFNRGSYDPMTQDISKRRGGLACL